MLQNTVAESRLWMIVMLEGFEVLRVAPVTRFEAYRKEIANTEALLHQLPTPPTGDDLERLPVQQSKKREASERYQQVRQKYMCQAVLDQMSNKVASGHS